MTFKRFYRAHPGNTTAGVNDVTQPSGGNDDISYFQPNQRQRRGIYQFGATPQDWRNNSQALKGRNIKAPTKVVLQRCARFNPIFLCVMLAAGTCAVAQEENFDGVREPKSSTEAVAAASDESTSESIRLNFRNASLDTVLNYLSKAAGFAVVRMTDVNGRIDLWSHQPLNKEETVDLLNTALYSKGYAAVRSDRILMIVPLEDAKKNAIPVEIGNVPENIPKTDEVVTQIIPVRYVDATKLIDNLKNLLSENATISSNESSNAIVLTDTRKNIRRITEIIRALDTSISQIATIRVFPLKYSDAKQMAELINKVFELPQSEDNNNNRRPRFGGPFGRGGGGDDNNNNNNQSVARQAAVRVLAAADERTNAVIVNAPDDLMPTIEQLIRETDTTNELVTVYRVFLLKRADAAEMAELINNLYKDETSTRSNNQNQRNGRRNFFQRMMQQAQQQNNEQSSRSLQESKVLAVADTRTNAVVVSAVESQMEQIEHIVEKLDSDTGRNKDVFVYSLKNADAQAVSEILDSMFSEGANGGSSRNSNSRSSDTNNTSGRSSNRGNTGGQSNINFGRN